MYIAATTVWVVERRTDTWRPLAAGLVPTAFGDRSEAERTARDLDRLFGWTVRVVASSR